MKDGVMLTVRLGLTLSTVTFLGGCLGEPVPLTVPKGVATVERDGELFDQSPEHPLMDVPAGTVIDELTGLDGCWGAFFVAQPGELVAVDVEYYQFDFGQGRAIYQVLQRSSDVGFLGRLGLDIDVAAETVYQLELPSADRIRLRPVSAWLSSTFELEPELMFHDPDPSPFDLQITLDGDAFKIGDSEGASPDFSAPHRANLVFHRFVCPADACQTCEP